MPRNICREFYQLCALKVFLFSCLSQSTGLKVVYTVCLHVQLQPISRWLIDNSDSMDMDNTASKICCTLECPKINFKGKLMLFQFVGKIGKSHVFLDNRNSSAKQDQNHLLQDREPISKKQFNSRKHCSSQFICFKHTRNQMEE